MRILLSGRRVVAGMPRLVKSGVIVALLAVFTLGGLSVIGVGMLAVPMAHAASGCTGYEDAIASIPDLSHNANNDPRVTGNSAGMSGGCIKQHGPDVA